MTSRGRRMFEIFIVLEGLLEIVYTGMWTKGSFFYGPKQSVQIFSIWIPGGSASQKRCTWLHACFKELYWPKMYCTQLQMSKNSWMSILRLTRLNSAKYMVLEVSPMLKLESSLSCQTPSFISSTRKYNPEICYNISRRIGMVCIGICNWLYVFNSVKNTISAVLVGRLVLNSLCFDYFVLLCVQQWQITAVTDFRTRKYFPVSHVAYLSVWCKKCSE